MASSVLPDPDTPFGTRVRERLRDDSVIWFTAVGKDGTPQPNPVWFLWENGTLLVYNAPDAYRLTHIQHRPQVSLHFNSDASGGDIVVLRGNARRVDDLPPPHQHQDYLAKYREGMIEVSGDVETFGRQFPTALRVDLTRVRGFLE
ncbi:TIGR03667 family PPOX class F420-dependent oxidoreductase [Haloechinothrix sp. LS1_15]|uniref:TIGR03667 family PPOX class F420-dependent oxidoreductase n=1 Tax=Haloechinothrix sp. LS1_15 TaxID=2652248 RepID=UPI0029451AAC|nr:TIGR03667 family PPOX class F420-dependent oxidoreductase [Haloechinothrix sp. LS1_15]MDV6014351.1 TIGR03667 family PPOX class F420-dependent oxidoreductase [Haloechinothrix sp. LS1_15]